MTDHLVRSEKYLARIRAIVAEAPPVSDMSDEQRETLRRLLAPPTTEPTMRDQTAQELESKFGIPSV